MNSNDYYMFYAVAAMTMVVSYEENLGDVIKMEDKFTEKEKQSLQESAVGRTLQDLSDDDEFNRQLASFLNNVSETEQKVILASASGYRSVNATDDLAPAILGVQLRNSLKSLTTLERHTVAWQMIKLLAYQAHPVVEEEVNRVIGNHANFIGDYVEPR